MKKNSTQLANRRRFIKTAINDQKEAARQLKRKAKGLENCRNLTDTIEALKDILYISETIIHLDNRYS